MLESFHGGATSTETETMEKRFTSSVTNEDGGSFQLVEEDSPKLETIGVKDITSLCNNTATTLRTEDNFTGTFAPYMHKND